MAIETHLNHYNDAIDKVNAATRQQETDLKTKKESLKSHIEQFSHRNVFMKLLLFIPYFFSKWSYESDIDDLETLVSKAPDKKESALRILVLESARDMMTNGEESELLATKEQEHALLKKLYNMTLGTEEAGTQALREIQSAISSLNDAEAFEALDMVTDNKFIAAASTAQNFSASDATQQANRALQRFQHRLNEQQTYWEEIKHNPLVETIDFAIDMMSEGGVFDALGSLFSLITLSNTKGKLNQLYSELTPVVQSVTDERKEQGIKLKHHEAKLLEFKTSSREKVVPVLNSRGVDVTVEFASSITELYAPSART